MFEVELEFVTGTPNTEKYFVKGETIPELIMNCFHACMAEDMETLILPHNIKQREDKDGLS